MAPEPDPARHPAPVIALLAALPEEISGLRREMGLAPEAVPGLRHPAYAGPYRGWRVLLVRSGMGRERAAAAAVLARYPEATLVSIGFSGALDARLQVGDLVLPSELVGLPGPGGDEVEPAVYRPDERLLRAAAQALEAAGLRVLQGPTVTAPDIVTTPAGRQRQASLTGALAVDMESYGVARAATERGLPFLALRSISDTQADVLLPFDQMAGLDGEPSLRMLAAHLLRHPRRLAAVVSLARNAGRARQSLTAGVACIVAAL